MAEPISMNLIQSSTMKVLSEQTNRAGRDDSSCDHERHKICNGWYLEMVVPISSILGLLILYSENVVGL